MALIIVKSIRSGDIDVLVERDDRPSVVDVFPAVSQKHLAPSFNRASTEQSYDTASGFIEILSGGREALRRGNHRAYPVRVRVLSRRTDTVFEFVGARTLCSRTRHRYRRMHGRLFVARDPFLREKEQSRPNIRGNVPNPCQPWPLQG